MDIEEAKNILKHIAFDEYEWFIGTNKCATRISPIDANNAIETVLAELEKKQNMTICGKTPEEAYKILSGIELERQLEIKVTMDNLSVIVEKINKELEKQIQEQFQEQINNITKRK